jgi:hypothetical protein
LCSSCDKGNPDADDKAEGAGVTPRNHNFQQDDGEDESDANTTAKEAERFTPMADSNDKDKVVDITQIRDLPSATITEADQKMMTVYGDYVHQNNGTHLDGGVKGDNAWQDNAHRPASPAVQRAKWSSW